MFSLSFSFFFSFFFYYSYVHTRLGSFLPPAPTPPLPPTPPPPNTQQREYKNNRKEQGFLVVEIRIAIQGIDEN
jgi:hypothetical protein